MLDKTGEELQFITEHSKSDWPILTISFLLTVSRFWELTQIAKAIETTKTREKNPLNIPSFFIYYKYIAKFAI